MKAIKKPIKLSFRVAQSEESLSTLEGPVIAKAGDAILTGTKGEVWPIGWDKFISTYDVDLDSNSCSKKPIVVEVVQMHEPFSVKLSWSDSTIYGKAGDYLITYAPNDFGIVDKDVFDETYTIVEP